MDVHQFLLQMLIFLVAGVALVPLAQKAKLGAVLGYLIAGFLIGPNGLALLGSNVQDILHFAEFGVVMMLFIIGLELRPSRLWELRTPILGMGTTQVVLSVLLLHFVIINYGLPWQQSLAIALIFSLSSTAIILQTLTERRLLATPLGKDAFSILLLQDIAVIPILAILPLLSWTRTTSISPISLTDHVLKAIFVMAIIGAIVIVGKYALRPIFRIIAKTGLFELFTGFSLLIVVGISLIMDSLELSAALGAFVAGVVLSESEYRHELEAEIKPFKGLLLGLFFMSVGAGADINLLLSHPVLVLILVLLLLITKAASIFVSVRLFKRSLNHALCLAVSLAQGGEFGFVLFSFAQKNNVIPDDIIKISVLVIALSMAMTPLIINLGFHLADRWLSEKMAKPNPISEDSPEPGTVIFAGYGRFGQIIGRILGHCGISITVLERDPDQIAAARKFGSTVYYGDACRIDLLRGAGAETAKAILLATDDPMSNREIFTLCRQYFPHLKVFVRARDRGEAYEWHQLGADVIVRETFYSALKISEKLLAVLGLRRHQAYRAVKIFEHHDEHDLVRMALLHTNEPAYLSAKQQNKAQLEAVLREELLHRHEFRDVRWQRPDEPEEPETRV